MTLAIQGDWGTGKSSIMEMVEAKINEDNKKGIYNLVSFNTWQFSQFNLGEQLPVVLLSRLLKEVSGEDEKTAATTETIKKALFKLSSSLLKTFTKDLVDLESLKPEDTTDLIEQIGTLKANFQELIDKKAGEKGRVIIFVDDLDRLDPARAVELLEVLKIKSLGLAGISFYSLMLHEGTPIVNRISDEDLTVMMDTSREKIFFDMIMDELAVEGYKPFELTKLIRNGLDRYDYVRIRHSGGSCIGIGHGAGGNLDRYVFHNSVRFPLLDPTVPVSAMGRVLKQDYFILDEFINDLQKMEVNLDRYSRRLGFDLKTLVMDILERAESENLINVSGPNIVLTQDGIFWGNNFIDELIRRIVSTKEA